MLTLQNALARARAQLGSNFDSQVDFLPSIPRQGTPNFGTWPHLGALHFKTPTLKATSILTGAPRQASINAKGPPSIWEGPPLPTAGLFTLHF